jgi:hypothetical protein
LYLYFLLSHECESVPNFPFEEWKLKREGLTWSAAPETAKK